MTDATVASPCTSVCRIDERTGWCEGCLRTLDEIALWSSLDNRARRAVLNAVGSRREQVAPAATGDAE